MQIRTYDDKDAATFDLKGLAEYFSSCLDFKESERIKAILQAEAYFQGYRDAVYEIKNMLEASNYRTEEGKIKIFGREG